MATPTHPRHRVPCVAAALALTIATQAASINVGADAPAKNTAAVEEPSSVLDTQRVPVAQMLDPDSIRSIDLPSQPPRLKWRRRSSKEVPAKQPTKPKPRRVAEAFELPESTEPPTARPETADREQSSAIEEPREPAPFPLAVEAEAPEAAEPAPEEPADDPATPRLAAKPNQGGDAARGPSPDADRDAADKGADSPATPPAAARAEETKPQAVAEKEEAPAEPPAQPDAEQPPAKDQAEPADPKAEPQREASTAKPRPEPQGDAQRTPEATGPATESSTPPAPDFAAKPLKPLTRSQQYLRRRLRSVLSYYYRRPLHSRDHDPWEVMHGMLAYGLHSRVLDGTASGKPVTAIGYLCFNKPCKNKRLLHLTPEGEIDAEVAYGLQGHRGQFLAMLAQCNVSPDYPIQIEDRRFTIRDLIEHEKLTCYTDTELTFKLIGLSHYLDLDEQWVNDQGEPWNFPRLIREERSQPIRGAACGGTHRLSGLALAARLRVERGQPLSGEYLAARQFTAEQQAYAFRLQNRDGSLSTEWFRGPGDEEDINRRVRTTGHILEWLIYSLPDERMTDYRTVRAVNYLTSLLASNTDNAWDVGPLSHALHALLLYDQRVFQPHDAATVAATGAGRRSPAAQRTLSYRTIRSRWSSRYPSAEEIDEFREAEQQGGGLRALLGIGSAKGRRSRR